MSDLILIILGVAVLALLAILLRTSLSSSASRGVDSAAELERQRRIEADMTALRALQAEVNGRLDQLTQSVGQRFDSLQSRVGDGLKETAEKTSENLAKLNERLVSIDAAQKHLGSLANEVTNLRDVLANKQSRGAFGQARMEAIIRDALPLGSYEFQATLQNRTRPDCVIRLPNDPRPLIVDSKFPLEGITAFRDAKTDEEKKQAAQRVRADITAHLKDIGEKYILAGETQELAIMFVPSESIYADLYEFFDDLVQKAQRARIMIASPSLLMMAVQMLQVIVKDSRMREQAHLVQLEVGKILDDVRRLNQRVDNLSKHFEQAQKDIGDINTSARAISRRGDNIGSMNLAPEAGIGETGAVAELLTPERPQP